jgi:hypothetical protein
MGTTSVPKKIGVASTSYGNYTRGEEKKLRLGPILLKKLGDR